MFEIVNKLHAELKSIIEMPDVHRRVAKIGMVPLCTLSPRTCSKVVSQAPQRRIAVIRWTPCFA
jgi:hypothetical protein